MATGDIITTIRANVSDFTSKMSQVESRMKRTGQRMKTIGSNMSQFLTLPLAVAGGAAVKAASDFEDAMVEVEKVTNPEVAREMGDAIKGMAQDIPLATTELASLTADAARFGIQGTENIETFTRTVSRMSVATDLSANKAGSSLAKLATITKTPIPKVENLGSSINELSNTAATSSAEIVDNMLRASKGLGRLGASNTQMAALAATLNEVSPQASRAGTQMNRLSSVLLRPGKVDDLSESLGMSTTQFKNMRENSPVQLLTMMAETMSKGGSQANELSDDLGEVATKAVSGLAQNLEGLERNMNTANKSFEEGTSLQREFEAAADTFSARMQILKNRLFDLGTTIGKKLIPFVEDLAGFVDSVATKFKNASDGTQNMILKIGGLVAAIGPLLAILGTLSTSVIPAVVAGFSALTGPIGLTIAGVTGLVAVLSQLSGKEKSAADSALTLKAAQEEAKKATAKEREEVDRLVDVAGNELATKQKRIEALNKLKKIAPDHFENLSIEKGKIEGLEKAQKAYNDEILREARVKAVKDKIAPIEKNITDLLLKKKDLEEKMNQKVAFRKDLQGKSAEQRKQILKNEKNGLTIIESRLNKLREQRDKMTDLINKQKDLNKEKAEEPKGGGASKAEESKGGGASFDLSQGAGGMEKMAMRTGDAAKLVEQRKTSIVGSFREMQDRVSKGAKEMPKNWKRAQEALSQTNKIIESSMRQTATAFAENIGKMIASSAKSQNFGRILLNSIASFMKKLGEMLITVGVSIKAFQESLKSLNAFVAIGAGTALLAAASAFRSAAQDGPERPQGGGPALAEGGIVTKEVNNATIGENGPEAVLPLNKMDRFMGGGKQQTGKVEFEIQGDKLVGILNRQNKNDRAT